MTFPTYEVSLISHNHNVTCLNYIVMLSPDLLESIYTANRKPSGGLIYLMVFVRLYPVNKNYFTLIWSKN